MSATRSRWKLLHEVVWVEGWINLLLLACALAVGLVIFFAG